MGYTYREWSISDYYNFSVEFNRIESYNEYCKKWLPYFNKEVSAFTSKLDWTINDIVDIKDYNRVKRNINLLLDTINSSLTRLAIDDSQANQVFNVEKANELEVRLKENLDFLGKAQFHNEICGIAVCGNNLRLGGVI